MIHRFASAAIRRTQRLRPRSRPAILMYHRVAHETFDPWGLAVHPERFERQMDWLAANRDVLPLSEFARRHRNGKLRPDNVAVTFDDGYACTAHTAAPILDRLGIPATIFLPTELIRRQREFWWDELQRVVLEADEAQLTIDGELVDLGHASASDRQWRPHDAAKTKRQSAFQLLWNRLKRMSDVERDAWLQQIREQLQSTSKTRATHRPMTSQEASDLNSSVVEFGSHGRTHPDLIALPDGEQLREISESSQECSILTGTRPRSFAYPYGRHDRRSAEIVARAGYLCACTSERGFVRRSSDPFALPRLQVEDWDAETFRRKLLAG